MEYIYAALILHKAGKKVDEEGIKKILTAAGVEVNEARVKALVAALEGVDIEEALKTIAPVAAAAPAGETPAGEAKKEKKKEEKKSEEEAAAGLSQLFG